MTRLKDQNCELQERLVSCGKHYAEVFRRLREEQQRQHPKISQLYAEMDKRASESDGDQSEMKKQMEELCNIYDQIITAACDECEKYLQNIERMEHENLQLSARGRMSSSPRKSRPGSSLDTDRYYTQLLQLSENANSELRKEIERLHKEMNMREQRLFDETMARTDNTNREQTEKMKAQISELSQEMSLLNVDNRALREKILRTENENEILMKRVKDSGMVDTELQSLQSNLDNQLDLNHQLESKVKSLELIRMEHNSICSKIKSELEEAKANAVKYETEYQQLSQRIQRSKELQQNYEAMNLELTNRLQNLRHENSCLTENLKSTQQELLHSQTLNMQELHESNNQEVNAKLMEEAVEQHQQELRDLTVKLEAVEKQRDHANMKVKALRDRLKNMQDSWQKISTDTETSFSALRVQYQQQIKEYKSIVQSLKSQNASLNTRIESLKKINSQHNASQIGALEQQVRHCFNTNCKHFGVLYLY